LVTNNFLKSGMTPLKPGPFKTPPGEGGALRARKLPARSLSR
jgi:hypothetical protein